VGGRFNVVYFVRFQCESEQECERDKKDPLDFLMGCCSSSLFFLPLGLRGS